LSRFAALFAALCLPVPAVATPFAGSATCAPCHAAEHAAWAGSTHAQAMRPADAPDAAAFDGHRRPFPSLTLRPLIAGTRRVFDTGDPSASQPLAYVLGVREVEQYLTPVGRGRFQALPVGYDPERREWFDIFPEAPASTDWAHWSNPGATANSQCIECHVTGYTKGYDPAADRYDSTWVEHGVGCEACHGAGAAHAADPTTLVTGVRSGPEGANV
jgi:hypothetical protein